MARLWARSVWFGWACLAATLLPASTSVAQDAPPRPAPNALPPALDREAELLRRLERMEAANREMSRQMDALRSEINSLKAAATAEPPPNLDDGEAARDEAAGADLGSIRQRDSEPSPPPETLKGRFGRGFAFESIDQEYLLEVHQETQLDYRAFDPNGEEFARNEFVLPRARIIFEGHVTRPIEYRFALQRGFAQLDVLDAWINFNQDDRLKLMAGRFMSPMNYEQFAVPNMWFIAPERSLFTSNLGLNRMPGLMLWGNSRDDRADYALAIMNGPRNSYEDFNEAKDVLAYLNLRPWRDGDGEGWLENFNIGGSFVYGAQDNPLVPRSFRVATNASNAGQADNAAPPFFSFNDGVVERGQRTFWSAHAALFKGGLSVIADYNGGILRYAESPRAIESVVSPVSGMGVTAGYFLTGEQVTRRAVVEPLRPFNLRPGKRGPGAIEIVAKYSDIDLGRNLLDEGLANPELWSQKAWVTNLGANWYLNSYLKLYFYWQHAEFGDPVFYAPGRKALTNEMLWLRLQLFF